MSALDDEKMALALAAALQRAEGDLSMRPHTLAYWRQLTEVILEDLPVLDDICEYRARQINAEKSNRQPCPAAHPCGPCLGEVGHGEIHWVLTPHGTRAIWTEDV